MTPPMTPREKVELKPCPFCGGDAVAGSNFDNDHYVMCGADCDRCGGMVGYMKTEMAAIENWNRRTALASGSGDHAELERLADRNVELSVLAYKWMEAHDALKSGQPYDYPSPADVPTLLAENAALRDERDQIAGESIWWKGVIGDGSHQPSGEVRSIKHLHPAMVKPIYEANKGTAVADVIAGLIFLLAINQNREQFLVADANERRTEAERKLAEAVGLLAEAASELESEVEARYKGVKDHPAMTPKYDRDMDTPQRINAWLSKEAERG